MLIKNDLIQQCRVRQKQLLAVNMILSIKRRRRKRIINSILMNHRKFSHYRKRNTWKDFLEDMLLENDFETTTRMPSLAAFNELCEVLKPGLMSSNRQYKSTIRNIEVEFKVYLTLRILAGGDPLDLNKTIGISKYSVYRYFKLTVDLINNNPIFSINLPTGDKLNEIKEGFAKLSGDRDFNESVTRPTPMKGCVGALDGYLALIDKPVCKGSSDYYFSGHYFHHGLNVQAMCDHMCRFTYFNVIAPGKCPDSVALQKCLDLLDWLSELPTGRNDSECYFILADAAYICNRKVLTPFKGPQKLVPQNDSYNFYLSQLRIRIEQSFGLLSNKWRILRTPLGSDIKRAVRILNCCARLHNFVIDRRPVIDDEDNFIEDDDMEVLITQSDSQLGYVPSDTEQVSQDRRRKLTIHDPSLRAQIVSNRIVVGNWNRPNYNIVRNNNN